MFDLYALSSHSNDLFISHYNNLSILHSFLIFGVGSTSGKAN
jgi:hypothetical protein